MRVRRLKLQIVLLFGLLPAQDPSIRFVPRVVYPDFAQLHRLCADDSMGVSAPRPNDERRSVQALLGPALVELQIHQMGDSVTSFPRARDQVVGLLRARPQSLTRFPNWAEGTPFRNWGIVGSVHYTGGRASPFEVVGNHLCMADSLGGMWWLRLEAVDVWPDSS